MVTVSASLFLMVTVGVFSAVVTANGTVFTSNASVINLEPLATTVPSIVVDNKTVLLESRALHAAKIKCGPLVGTAKECMVSPALTIHTLVSILLAKSVPLSNPPLNPEYDKSIAKH